MQHKNFCESDALNVMTVDTAFGKLVTIGRFAAETDFTFPMLPSVARELAADLVKQADEAEGV